MPDPTAGRCPQCRAGPLLVEPDQSRHCLLCSYRTPPEPPPEPQCSRRNCSQPTVSPFRNCAYHRQLERNRARQNRRQRAQAGRCRRKSCPNPLPPEGNSALCPECRERHRADRRRRYAERQAQGRCGHCGKAPVEPGYVLCPTCRAAGIARAQERRDAAKLAAQEAAIAARSAATTAPDQTAAA